MSLATTEVVTRVVKIEEEVEPSLPKLCTKERIPQTIA